jgi:hypothetical protein
LEKDKMNGNIQRYPRYPFSQTVTFEMSALLALREIHKKEMEGSAKNVSDGGLCFVTDRVLEESQIIKIKIPILNGAAAIPTLAKVQWVKKYPLMETQESAQPAIAGQRRKQYTVGLCFIF